jgi:hypothetical protein
MHLLLFGFTSSLGVLALPLLHAAGHTLVAYVRSPDKIPEAYREWIELFEGTLDEADKVRALFEREKPFDAMRASPDCLSVRWSRADGSLAVSCLGPSSRLYPPHPSGQPISCFYALLYQMLKTLTAESGGTFKPPRMLALGTVSQHNDAKDHFSLTARAAETAIMIGSPTGSPPHTEGSARLLSLILPCATSLLGRQALGSRDYGRIGGRRRRVDHARVPLLLDGRLDVDPHSRCSLSPSLTSASASASFSPGASRRRRSSPRQAITVTEPVCLGPDVVLAAELGRR